LNIYFEIDTGAAIFNNLDEMKKASEGMHKQLLELISTLSDGSISDKSSSVSKALFGPHHRLNSTVRYIREPMGRKIGKKCYCHFSLAYVFLQL
jgi:hypothetical protein